MYVWCWSLWVIILTTLLPKINSASKRKTLNRWVHARIMLKTFKFDLSENCDGRIPANVRRIDNELSFRGPIHGLSSFDLSETEGSWSKNLPNGRRSSSEFCQRLVDLTPGTMCEIYEIYSVIPCIENSVISLKSPNLVPQYRKIPSQPIPS